VFEVFIDAVQLTVVSQMQYDVLHVRFGAAVLQEIFMARFWVILKFVKVGEVKAIL